MAKNPADKGVVSENFKGVGPVTRKMLAARARELALIAGHAKPSQTDRDQAKRELAGDKGLDPREEILESLPMMKRWDPVPGSEGRQVPDAPNEDEDEEGRSEAQRLVEEGVDEAGHDQMLEAARAARKKQRLG